MRVEGLSAKTQDHLKIARDLHEYIGEEVTLSDVAERMDEKKPATNEAVKRLATRDPVNHESHRGTSLSDHGRNIALIMVRHHQLIESFLVPTLGYTWDKVREEAEKLEHTVSEEFINRIDAMLGFPERDPRGDPVPSVGSAIADAIHTDLTDIEAGAVTIVDRISNSDPELLHYLITSRIGLRTVLRTEATPYAGMHIFAILDEAGDTKPKKVHVADSALWTIRATSTVN